MIFFLKFCRFEITPVQTPLDIDLLTDESVKIYKNELDPLNLDYDVTVALQRNTSRNGRTPFLQLDFRLERKLSRSVIEMIAPPGLLVIVSWVFKNKQKLTDTSLVSM